MLCFLSLESRHTQASYLASRLTLQLSRQHHLVLHAGKSYGRLLGRIRKDILP